jgi:hypothetical protein
MNTSGIGEDEDARRQRQSGCHSAGDALRRIADLLDSIPDLPSHVVTVYSDDVQIGVLFGAGDDAAVRRAAVRRLLALLGGTPTTGSIEYGGTGMLGPYTVEVSTGFD